MDSETEYQLYSELSDIKQVLMGIERCLQLMVLGRTPLHNKKKVRDYLTFKTHKLEALV